jgi:hypothetical protein
VDAYIWYFGRDGGGLVRMGRLAWGGSKVKWAINIDWNEIVVKCHYKSNRQIGSQFVLYVSRIRESGLAHPTLCSDITQAHFVETATTHLDARNASDAFDAAAF